MEYPFEKRHRFTTKLSDEGCFRFVSYNILADLYADSDYSRDMLFSYCPADKLSMDYRKNLLLKEIKGYNADIICLQEVDEKVYNKDLAPGLDGNGLAGLLSLKTGDAREGTAMFFRKSKLKIVSRHDLPLSRALQNDTLFGDLLEKVSKSKAFKEKLFARTQVLQVTVFETVADPSQKILVATVHLFFHPRAPHIRIIQAAVCVRHIERIVDQLSEEGESRPAVVFCGDFNSSPDMGVHTFIQEQHISANHADWYAGGKPELLPDMELEHVSRFRSVYDELPRYTNYVSGFSGCLDYIYAEFDRWHPVMVVPMPSHEDVTRLTALPNEIFPSDHLAVVCDLELVDDDEKAMFDEDTTI